VGGVGADVAAGGRHSLGIATPNLPSPPPSGKVIYDFYISNELINLTVAAMALETRNQIA